jgi:hypothetical protein
MKKLNFAYPAIGLLILALAMAAGAQTKRAKTVKPKPKTVAAVTNDEIVFGLKDALSNGVTHAISELGRQGGYYNNPRVKIPMPGALQPVEKALRFLKQDDLVDDFVVAMNRAAEQAVVEGTLVFADSIRQMTIQDAKNILSGPKDAATQYFRRTSEEKLREKFLPIVKTSTEEMGVTAQYKKLMQKGGGLAALTGQKDFDIDKYVTEKALDGLFLMIADEEKRIRENPLARTTTILQKVFGSVIK